MNLVTLKIKPKSYFGTYPKGDTIFGQIVSEFYLSGDRSFDNYLGGSPKLVVSDMLPFGYFPKPILPLGCFGKNLDKKVLRKAKFITLKALQNGELLEGCEDIKFFEELTTVKNSINRTTFSTGEGDFAPFGVVEKNIFKELWMFVLADESIRTKTLQTIQKIGKYGFGKDTSVGRGVFECEVIDFEIPKIDTNYYLTISPVIPNDENILKSFYEPITRFGKYGYHGADSRAFKKPTLLCESGSVFQLSKDAKSLGSAHNNGLENKPSFIQGYSIAIPIRIKDEQCLNAR